MFRFAHSSRPLVSLLTVAVAVFAGGCLHFYPPTAPVPGLDRSTTKAIWSCQATISKASGRYSATIRRALLGCVSKALAVQLDYENGLIDLATYESEITRQADRCTAGLAKVTRASSKYVEKVIAGCLLVADPLLSEYDALRAQMLADVVSGNTTVESIDEFAGELCGLTSLAAQLDTVLSFPRLLEMMALLDPELLVFDEGLPTEESPFVTSFVGFETDSRCEGWTPRRVAALSLGR